MEGIAISIIPPRQPRYEAGAPVAISVAGGHSAGDVSTRLNVAGCGFVEIGFAFPGGGRDESRSGGTYDHRGPNCVQALRDVILFAMGKIADDQGQKIQDLVGDIRVLTSNVGLHGGSHGGNACGAVMGLHGEDFPTLAWYVSMESPYGEGAVGAELGSRRGRLCPAYDADTGVLDLTKLAFDPNSEIRPFGAGRFGDPSLPALVGSLFFDMDGDGKCKSEEDYRLQPPVFDVGQGRKAWYSVRLMREAEKRSLFGDPRPAHIPTLDDAIEFWRYRDATGLVAEAVRKIPNLAAIVVAGETDHVQIAPDHPHIRAQVNAFQEAGAKLIRLNPDRAYVEWLFDREASGLPDNDAGLPYTAKTISAALCPDRAAPKQLLSPAAMCELADRVQAGNYEPNLDRVLFPDAPKASGPPGLKRRPTNREGPPPRHIRRTSDASPQREGMPPGPDRGVTFQLADLPENASWKPAPRADSHLALAQRPQSQAVARSKNQPLIRPDVGPVGHTRILSQSRAEIEVVILTPSKPRYREGAPVVVNVRPAVQPQPAGRADRCGLTALGFVVVNFGYPTGERFDQGGPNCKRALADVLLFAMGKTTDAQGRRIEELSPIEVQTGVVGAIGWSHGGNAVVTTLQAHPDELQDMAFYVSYESPCGTSEESLGDIVNVDYGGVRFDPDPRRDADGNGLPWDDGRNPYYTPGKTLDFSRLCWDPDVTWRWRLAPAKGVLFLDGNGNGKFDVVQVGVSGAARGGVTQTPDINRDGRIDKNEDFPLSFLHGTANDRGQRFYSLSVTEAAAQTVFRDGFPPDIATVEQARAYWSERDMAAGFEQLEACFDDLLVCIYAGRQDHVQAQSDCPHIRAQYTGLRRAGIGWVRINPDPVYARYVLGDCDHKLPANQPNQPVAAEAMWQMTEPARKELGNVFMAAGVCELADRVKASWKEPLGGSVLFADAPKVRANAPDYFWATEQLVSGDKTDSNTLYLCAIIHNEEDRRPRGPTGRADFDGDRDVLTFTTDQYRKIGRLFQEYDAKINLQCDWTFADGARKFDPEFFGDWEAMGHDTDAHAHESHVSYSEVKRRLKAAGAHPTRVIGGTLEDDIQQRLSRFETVWPEFEVLWGVATKHHRLPEEKTGYVWRPAKSGSWFNHDPQGKIIYVGGNARPMQVEAIREAYAEARSDKVNVYSIFLGSFEAPERSECRLGLASFEEFLKEVQELQKTCDVQWKSLSEVAGVFKTREAEGSLDFSDIDVNAIPRDEPGLAIPGRSRKKPIHKSAPGREADYNNDGTVDDFEMRRWRRQTDRPGPSSGPQAHDRTDKPQSPPVSDLVAHSTAANDTPDAPRYLLTILNLNYFPQSADQRMAADALQQFVAMARERNVEPEMFFTGLSFDTYLQHAPEMMKELKQSGREWHHHGSNRPPKPTPIDRTRGLSWPEAIEAVGEYEQYEIVPPGPRPGIRPGERPENRPEGLLDRSRVGGLKKMCAYFGRSPLATGRFVRAPILEVCKQYGVKMGVGVQDFYKLDSAWFWHMDTLNRPDDVFVHPTWDFNPWARHCWTIQQGDRPDAAFAPRLPGDAIDVKQKIERRLAELDPKLPAFFTYCFHDNDFFGYNWRSPERYSEGYREFYMAKCEEFLDWLVKERGLVPISLRQAYEMAASQNLKPVADEAEAMARQFIRSVDHEGGLPPHVATSRSAYSLTEAWQLFAARLAGRDPEFPELLGPIELLPPSRDPGVFEAEDIRSSAQSVRIKGHIDAAVQVGRSEVNAAEFLYLMAQAVLENDSIQGVSVEMIQLFVSAGRMGDALDKLQFWTHKPAFYADTGGRVQQATSTEVNIRGREMQRSKRNKRLPSKRRPPW